MDFHKGGHESTVTSQHVALDLLSPLALSFLVSRLFPVRVSRLVCPAATPFQSDSFHFPTTKITRNGPLVKLYKYIVIVTRTFGDAYALHRLFTQVSAGWWRSHPVCRHILHNHSLSANYYGATAGYLTKWFSAKDRHCDSPIALYCVVLD